MALGAKELAAALARVEGKTPPGLSTSPAQTGGDLWHAIDALAQQHGVKLTSEYRDPARNRAVGGASNSFHTRKDRDGRGLARDYAGSPDAMAGFAREVEQRYGKQLAELFYDPTNTAWKQGQRLGRNIGDHSDHVHLAWSGETPAPAGTANDLAAAIARVEGKRPATPREAPRVLPNPYSRTPATDARRRGETYGPTRHPATAARRKGQLYGPPPSREFVSGKLTQDPLKSDGISRPRTRGERIAGTIPGLFTPKAAGRIAQVREDAVTFAQRGLIPLPVRFKDEAEWKHYTRLLPDLERFEWERVRLRANRHLDKIHPLPKSGPAGAAGPTTPFRVLKDEEWAEAVAEGAKEWRWLTEYLRKRGHQLTERELQALRHHAAVRTLALGRELGIMDTAALETAINLAGDVIGGGAIAPAIRSGTMKLAGTQTAKLATELMERLPKSVQKAGAVTARVVNPVEVTAAGLTGAGIGAGVEVATNPNATPQDVGRAALGGGLGAAAFDVGGRALGLGGKAVVGKAKDVAELRGLNRALNEAELPIPAPVEQNRTLTPETQARAETRTARNERYATASERLLPADTANWERYELPNGRDTFAKDEAAKRVEFLNRRDGQPGKYRAAPLDPQLPNGRHVIERRAPEPSATKAPGEGSTPGAGEVRVGDPVRVPGHYELGTLRVEEVRGDQLVVRNPRRPTQTLVVPKDGAELQPVPEGHTFTGGTGIPTPSPSAAPAPPVVRTPAPEPSPAPAPAIPETNPVPSARTGAPIAPAAASAPEPIPPRATPEAPPVNGVLSEKRRAAARKRAEASEEIRSAVDELKQAFSGVRLSSGAGPLQNAFEPETLEAGVKLAQGLVKYGVATAEELAAAIEDHLGQAAPQFTQAVVAEYERRFGKLSGGVAHTPEAFPAQSRTPRATPESETTVAPITGSGKPNVAAPSPAPPPAAVEQPSGGTPPPDRPAAATASPTGGEPARPQTEGYVNWEYVDTPEQVRDLVVEQARKNAPAIESQRRGVRSNEETRKAARELGFTPTEAKRIAAGKALNAEQLYALRGMMLDLAQKAKDAAEEYKQTPTEENLLRATAAIKEYQAVHRSMAGARAEAGRALQQFKMISQAMETPGPATLKEKATKRLLDQLGESELNETLVKALAALPDDNPEALMRFIREQARFTTAEKIEAYWVSNILSGVKTQFRNLTSNSLFATAQLPERALRGLIDAPLAAMSKRPREYYAAEALPAAVAYLRGIPAGLRKGLYALRHGWAPDAAATLEVPGHYEFSGVAAPLNAPSRLLMAADTVSKTMALEAELTALATRQALREGKRGTAARQRIAELLEAPDPEMVEKAAEYARYTTFTSDPDELTKRLLRIRNWRIPAEFDIKGEKLTIPQPLAGLRPAFFLAAFVNTPSNIAKRMLEYSPGGLAGGTYLALRGHPHAAEMLARGVLGSAALGALASYAQAGFITGEPPKGAAERDAFYRSGKRPYSIKLGDWWVSYKNLGPLATSLVIVAAFHDAFEREGEMPQEERVMEAALAVGRFFADQSYMSGISDLLKALDQPGQGERSLSGIASGFVPFSGLQRNVAQALDPYVRDPEGLYERVIAGIPILSQRVPAKQDALGRDIRREGGTGWMAFAPEPFSPETRDPVDRELSRLKVHPPFIEKFLRIDGKREQLTREQQRELQREAGQAMYQAVQKELQDPGYRRLNDERREQLLKRVTDEAREEVRQRFRERLRPDRYGWGQYADGEDGQGVADELRRLGIHPPEAVRELTVNGQPVELDLKQQETYRRQVGRAIYDAAIRMMQHSKYQSAPPERRERALRKFLEKARSAARDRFRAELLRQQSR